jgi:hypothetical protein
MSKEFALIPRLVGLSVADNWDAATNEWDLYRVYDRPGSTCLCGKRNIRYMSVLRNVLNSTEVEVGSCCVVTITEHRPDLIHAGVERIQADVQASVNAQTLDFYASRVNMDEVAVKFYKQVMRKRTLTEKQLRWKRSLNCRILDYVARQAVVAELQQATAVADEDHYIPGDIIKVSRDKSRITVDGAQLHERCAPAVRTSDAGITPYYAIRSPKTGKVVEFEQAPGSTRVFWSSDTEVRMLLEIDG